MLCNVFGLFIAYLISNKILLLSAVLIAALWIYSHKLRKNVLLGEISASLLLISLFLGVGILNQKFDLPAYFSTLYFHYDLTEKLSKNDFLKEILLLGKKIPIYFGIKNVNTSFFSNDSSIVAI